DRVKVVEGHQPGKSVARADVVIEFDAKTALVKRGFVPNIRVTKDVQRIIETSEQKAAAGSRKVGSRNGKGELLSQLRGDRAECARVGECVRAGRTEHPLTITPRSVFVERR